MSLFKISEKLLNKAIATKSGEGKMKDGSSNNKQITYQKIIMTKNVTNILNILINSILR